MLGVRKKKVRKDGVKPGGPRVEIKDCHFVGVQFDKTTMDTVAEIAKGLTENARALGDLARFLQSKHVHVDAMLKIGG